MLLFIQFYCCSIFQANQWALHFSFGRNVRHFNALWSSVLPFQFNSICLKRIDVVADFNSEIKTWYWLKLDALFFFSHSTRHCNCSYTKNAVSRLVVAIEFAVNFSQCSIPFWSQISHGEKKIKKNKHVYSVKWALLWNRQICHEFLFFAPFIFHCFSLLSSEKNSFCSKT